MAWDATLPAGATKIKDSDDAIRANWAAIAVVLPNLAAGGGQVVFPATATPSANVNTLDDYEEGTWTPVIAFGGASVGVTYGTQTGWYTKIGNIVNVTMRIVLTSKGTSTGNAVVTGLTFTSATGIQTTVSIDLVKVSYADTYKGAIESNSTNIALLETTVAGVLTTITDANFAADSEIRISATYRVA